MILILRNAGVLTELVHHVYTMVLLKIVRHCAIRIQVVQIELDLEIDAQN